jgi:uncharacterized protein involved in exopolysaccharide biosynthesis
VYAFGGDLTSELVRMRAPFDSVDPEPNWEIDLWRSAFTLWASRWVIGAGTLMTVAVATVATLLVPETYQATATVFVTPPTFTNRLKARPLSVEAYSRLAESDYVTDRVRDKAAGVLQSDKFGLLRVVLYSSREPERPYLPLVGLVVEADDAERARVIANLWANVFVEEQGRIAGLYTANSVDFVLKALPKATEALGDAETNLANTQKRQAEALNQLRITSNLDLLNARALGREKTVVDLEMRLVETRLSLQLAKERLAQLEPELKRTPQHLANQRVATEELNPVFVGLASQIANERVTYNSLSSVERDLTVQLRVARETAEQLRAEQLSKQVALSNLEREHKLEEAILQRKVAEARARVAPLSNRIGDAQIAMVHTQSDVSLGALAKLPQSPVRPSLVMNASVAAVAGFLLSLAAVLLRHHLHQQPGASAATVERSAAGIP